MKKPGIYFALAALLCLAPAFAESAVFFSQQEAMEMAFGKDAEVLTEPVYLTPEQMLQIESEARVKLDSELFTFYTAEKNGKPMAYAAIESHIVRSQNESLLIVLTPDGELSRVEILAFHEPPEYMLQPRWFEQLRGKMIAQLVPGHGVDAVSGATLSSVSALGGVRKVKAMFRLAHPEAAH